MTNNIRVSLKDKKNKKLCELKIYIFESGEYQFYTDIKLNLS